MLQQHDLFCIFDTCLPVCLFVFFLLLDKNTETEDTKRHAEAMFKDVGEAYSVLSDTNKRRRYDSGEDLQDMEGPGGMHSGKLYYTAPLLYSMMVIASLVYDYWYWYCYYPFSYYWHDMN